MTRSPSHAHSCSALAALLIAAMLGLSACDTSTTSEATSAEASSSALVSDLTQTLDLTAEQVQTLDTQATMSSEDPEPGALWRLAGTLQETLTAPQKERLFTRLERLQARRAERPGRGRFLNRPGRRGEIAASLDVEQRAALREVFQAHRQARRALVEQRQDGTLSPEGFQEQLATLRAETREAAQDLLTSEQQAAWEARRAERTAFREAARAARADVLNLTEAQREAFAALRESAQESRAERLGELRADDDPNREALRTARNELRRELRQAAADLLTAEQQETIRLHRYLVLQARQQRT